MDIWVQFRLLIAGARTAEDVKVLHSRRARRDVGVFAAKAKRRRIVLELDRGQLVAFLPDTNRTISRW